MRTFKHWTVRYIIDRMSVMLYEKMNPNTPWLTRLMAHILEEWLKPDDVGFEWGSGRSTLWLASRIAHLTCIEDSPQWAKRVDGILASQHLSHKVDYRLLPLSNAKTIEPEYVSVVKTIPENTLDFCLIDGDKRDECALACISRIKPGGIIIIDNIERYFPRRAKSRSPNARELPDGFASKEWEEFGRIISNWRCVWTTNGISDTALWIKPTGNKTI